MSSDDCFQVRTATCFQPFAGISDGEPASRPVAGPLFLGMDTHALSDPALVRYAESLGVSGMTIRDALATNAYEERVRADFMSGVRSGVNGTPTFFIDGVRHDDSYAPEVLLAALERAAAGERHVPTGATPERTAGPAAG